MDLRGGPQAVTAILFDMDGVLVDTRRSYQTAVVETVRRFPALYLDLPSPAVTEAWVSGKPIL